MKTTSTTRHLMVGLMMTGLVGAGRPASAQGAALAASGHLRSSSAAIAAVIQQASERSKTFRGLVEAIDASDGLVYVQEGRCGRGVRACFVNVTMAGPNRILWVKVDTHKSDSDLMASIGHELQHTIEVLSEPTVTSQTAMYFFYDKVGRNGSGAFETTEAFRAGEAVYAEARQHDRDT